MALAVTSSSSSTSTAISKGIQNGSFRLLSDRPKPRTHGLNYSQRRFSVKALNAGPKRNDSIVPLAATILAPEGAKVVEKVEVEVEEENFEQLAKELENASPLEVMDKALEKFGNDIAIAFRNVGDLTTTPCVSRIF